MSESIIEKLGINMPFDGEDGCYLYAEKGTDKIIVNMESNKLLWAAPEMLERDIDFLNKIETLKRLYKESADETNSIVDSIRYKTLINVLEIFDFSPDKKATDKSWEEIKELIK